MGERCVALIPARGGSKGIPRKNIRLFAGKPLLAHSVEAGFCSNAVDEVYVSTEDDEISEIAISHGAKVISRPYELAGDEVSTYSVLEHAYVALGCPEIVVTLQPTSPLRKSIHIDQAFGLLDESVDTVVGVCHDHRFRWVQADGYGVPQFSCRLRRQDMGARYVENGALYISRSTVFESGDEVLGMGITSSGMVRLYPMDDMFSMEIDSLQDFCILETYANSINLGDK